MRCHSSVTNEAKLYKRPLYRGLKGEIHMENKTFTLTKRICKHGSQAVITIPKLLEHELKPGIIAEVKITILGEVAE